MIQQKIKATSFQTEDINEQGIVSGVLNYFGNKDHAGDITMKGAFSKSIKDITDSGRNLVVLWQHDHSKPIGVWKNLRETSRGLEGEAHLNLDVSLAKEAFALVKQGALSGISIGYYVVNESYDTTNKANLLHEISLLETSLVTFPCNDLSRTEGTKMKLKDNALPTVRELETILKEVGYSNTDAKHIVSKYMPDYIDPEEKARQEAAEKAEAQAQVEALIEAHGLKFVVEKEELEEEPEEEPEEEKGEEYDEEQKEEPEEDADEEKSNSLDAFFK